MKTTEDIFDNCNDFELNNLRDFDNKNVYDKLRFWNKKWYSEEEYKELELNYKLICERVKNENNKRNNK